MKKQWVVTGTSEKCGELLYLIRAESEKGALDRAAELTGRHVEEHDGRTFLVAPDGRPVKDDLELGCPRWCFEVQVFEALPDVNLR